MPDQVEVETQPNPDGLDPKRNAVAELEARLAETRNASAAELKAQSAAVDEERIDKYAENLLAEIQYEEAAAALLARSKWKADESEGADAGSTEQASDTPPTAPTAFTFGGGAQTDSADGAVDNEGE